MPPVKKKESRIQLRTSERDFSAIRRAAEQSGQTVSAFILESATERAERMLADQRHFELSPAQWEAFTAALDRPAKELGGLQRLLREPSVLERA